MSSGLLRFTILFISCLLIVVSSDTWATEPYVKQTNKDCIQCHLDNYYPTGDFFRAETVTKWHFHWWAFSIFFFIFWAGILGKIYIWNLGCGKALPVEKIKRKRFWEFLFFEAVLQLKILKTSFIRWFIFFSESLGFIALFFVFMALVFTKFVFKIDFFINGTGGLVLDFLLDFIGLVIFIGTIVSFVRRIVKNPDMITEREDIIAVLFLFIIVLTGFLLESFRIAALPVSNKACFSFVGYNIAGMIRHMDLPWTNIHYYTWLIHATIVFIFLSYIPFSKFIHFMACPVSILSVSDDPQG